MHASRFSEEQIIGMLKEQEAGGEAHAECLRGELHWPVSGRTLERDPVLEPGAGPRHDPLVEGRHNLNRPHSALSHRSPTESAATLAVETVAA